MCTRDRDRRRNVMQTADDRQMRNPSDYTICYVPCDESTYMSDRQVLCGYKNEDERRRKTQKCTACVESSQIIILWMCDDDKMTLIRYIIVLIFRHLIFAAFVSSARVDDGVECYRLSVDLISSAPDRLYARRQSVWVCDVRCRLAIVGDCLGLCARAIGTTLSK